ncbi:hypothetical protein [Singulisphaera acidiphila]
MEVNQFWVPDQTARPFDPDARRDSNDD